MTATRGATSPGLTVLLLSGGMDSAALAAWVKPDHTLFIDYGQRPAAAEARAARAVASEIGLHHEEVRVGLESLGGGLMRSSAVPSSWPSPEWWPYRNQLLVTMAAAWGVKTLPGVSDESCRLTILTGTVSSDGARHKDGTRAFYHALNGVLRSQEGQVSVSVPALDLTTSELVSESGVSDAVLGWTHSCHTSSLPCSDCPGCFKRVQVLEVLGRLQ